MTNSNNIRMSFDLIPSPDFWIQQVRIGFTSANFYGVFKKDRNEVKLRSDLVKQLAQNDSKSGKKRSKRDETRPNKISVNFDYCKPKKY